MTFVEFTTETGAGLGAGLLMGVLHGVTRLPMWVCAVVGLPVGAVAGWAITLGAWMVGGAAWYFLIGQHYKKPWETDGTSAEPPTTAGRPRE